MAKVLVADDERSICDAFRALLLSEGHSPLIAATGLEALRLVRSERPQAAFIDIRMPGLDGLAVLEEIASIDPTLPVTIMTAYGTLESAGRALKSNAFDYLGKPLELEQVRQVLRRALHRAVPRGVDGEAGGAGEPRDVTQPASAPTLVGQSRCMQDLFKLIVLLAANDLTVLIQGESGVGKELVARAIHDGGKRAREPFIAVNCAAIPATLIETELFGNERGAFTDAREARRGRFEAAGSGTLFLDEISELPLNLQGKLLRALQERTFERVGSASPVRLAARVVAATNRELAEEVRAGRFRADLFHRLNLATLRVPALRERKDDLPVLAAAILARANQDIGRAFTHIEPDAIERLKRHEWPGNVRELDHVIRRSMLTGRSPSLSIHDLVIDEAGEAPGSATSDTVDALLARAAGACVAGALEQSAAGREPTQLFEHAVATLENALVRAALEVTHGNQVAAARLLGVSRTTLRARLIEMKFPGSGSVQG
ncbi:MAG: sigma-54-dependent Fis family transcriptional regulator [Proteobacteria bacterium]|nr:sigma-54-dependent Fis family transcriptional regulator [Pseudomonadota bacterium]